MSYDCSIYTRMADIKKNEGVYTKMLYFFVLFKVNTQRWCSVFSFSGITNKKIFTSI